MTEREFLKIELLKSIEQYLKPYKFRLNKSLAEFIKKTPDGWNKYQVLFLIRDEGWEVKVGLLIRKNVVEDIFHQTSGFETKYQKSTPTIGALVNEYTKNEDYVFLLNEESEINEIAEKLYSIFKNTALPFFKKYDSVNSIEKAVNANVNDDLLTGAIFKGSKGVILAKLNASEIIEELITSYTRHYETFADGYYLPEFNSLLKDLKQLK